MDGSIDGMRDLVDELVELAGEAIDFIRADKIHEDEEEEIESLAIARKEREEWQNSTI